MGYRQVNNETSQQGNQAEEEDIGKAAMQADTGGRHSVRQAVENLDPGLGVVRWAVVAVERVVWTGALNVGE